DRLEPEHTAPTELAQPRQGVLQTVYGPQRIELIDDEPQPLIARGTIHGLEDAEAHPRGDHRAQGCNLTRAVWEEQHPALPSFLAGHPLAYPLTHRKRPCLLLGRIFERPHGGARDGAQRAEHLLAPFIQERPRGRAGEKFLQLLHRRCTNQVIELAIIPDVDPDELPRNGGEEGARVFAPDPLLAANVRNERARQLLDVVWMSHLAEQIPLERVGL